MKVKAIDIFSLFRPLNCFMAGIGATFALFLGNVKSVELYFLVFSCVFLTCAGGMIINDYFDREIDKANRKKRAYVIEAIGEKKTIALAFSLFFAGCLIAGFLGLLPFLLALLNSILLYVYSPKLKKIVFFKNLVIAYLTASVFLFGAIVSRSPVTGFALFILAFLSNVGREIVKDIVDMKGDKKAGIVTLPMLIGKFESSVIAAMFFVCAILLSPLPYILGIFSSAYLFALLPCIAVFFCASFFAPINPAKSSRFAKIAMNLGLVAFFFGKLF